MPPIGSYVTRGRLLLSQSSRGHEFRNSSYGENYEQPEGSDMYGDLTR